MARFPPIGRKPDTWAAAPSRISGLLFGQLQAAASRILVNLGQSPKRPASGAQIVRADAVEKLGVDAIVGFTLDFGCGTAALGQCHDDLAPVVRVHGARQIAALIRHTRISFTYLYQGPHNLPLRALSAKGRAVRRALFPSGQPVYLASAYGVPGMTGTGTRFLSWGCPRGQAHEGRRASVVLSRR